MLNSYLNDILVESYGSGAERPCSMWVWLRHQGLDCSSEEDLRMLVDATRPNCPRYSVLIHRLGPRTELRQDITAAVYAHAEILPPALPVLTEHLTSGALFVFVDGERRLPAAKASSLFKEALRWCAADYSDLLPEFQDHLEAAIRTG
jgi:hypothetical protein